MSPVVIDCSIALTWCFEDEASPETDGLFERVRDEGAIVPGLWYLEVSNVLLQAEKRGRIGIGDVTTRLDLMAELPISVDQQTTSRAWREIIDYFPKKCMCGSKGCRGRITGWKDLPDEKKEEYKGFVAPYLLELDAKHSCEEV
mgnify:CR=1 FL=1